MILVKKLKFFLFFVFYAKWPKKKYLGTFLVRKKSL